MKRLFLFAGYDKDAIIDDSLLYYLNHLSGLGDIVFVMDSDASETELAKVKQIPNVLYATAQKHGEYDFGSYKRAYIWARDNNILKNYDWIYLANDSVYGPLHSLAPLLQQLESSGADFTGMTEFQDKNIPTHIQSWFVGLSQQVVSTDVFDKFISSVGKEKLKADIICKYEVGMSQRLIRAGFKMTALMFNNSETIHIMYDTPAKALKLGVPFIKKRAISALEGIYNLYSHTDDFKLVDAIVENMTRNNIKIPNPDEKYKKIFRFTFLSIPVVTIFKKGRFAEYKICVFDRIPVMKVNLHKKSI